AGRIAVFRSSAGALGSNSSGTFFKTNPLMRLRAGALSVGRTADLELMVVFRQLRRRPPAGLWRLRAPRDLEAVAAGLEFEGGGGGVRASGLDALRVVGRAIAFGHASGIDGREAQR